MKRPRDKKKQGEGGRRNDGREMDERRVKERGEKERVEIEKGERGRKSEGEGEGESGVVKREERARLLREWQRDRRGKRKRTWHSREAR